MSENLIVSTSAESTAYGLARKAEHLYQEALKLNHMEKLVNELTSMQEEIRQKKEQVACLNQATAYIDQVSDALSTAMEVLSAPPIHVPLSEKVLMTVNESNAYTGVGKNRLRKIGKSKIGDIALWNGSKLMFKRERLEQYLNKSYSI